MPNELFDQTEAEVKEAEAELEKAETDVADVPAEEDNTEAPEEAEIVETEPPEEGKQKMVPLPALHEERHKRKALEAELRERDEKYARLDERLKAIQEQMTQPEAPKYEEDPFEYLRQTGERHDQNVQDLQKWRAEQIQRDEEHQRYMALQNKVAASENVFRKDHADYDDAISFLTETRKAEYAAMGYSDPVQQQQMIAQETIQLMQVADQNGVSPAEMAYNIAKNRGFRVPEQSDKLAAIQKGQERSKSLSGAGGGAAPQLDVEALANMSDDDFEKAMANGSWEKLLRAT